MRKRFLAAMLAATLAFTVAPVVPVNTSTVSAEEIAASLDCAVFFTAHTKGVAVGTEGVTIKFKNKTNDAATDNWHTPVFVIYTGDEPVVNGAGYTEYGVMRSDAYGWDGTGKTGTTAWKADTDLGAYDFAGWLAANKAGSDYEVSAIRKDNTVFMKINAGGLVTYAATPVAEGKTAYLSLSGEQCTLSGVNTSDYVSFEVPSELASVVPDAPAAPATPAPGGDVAGTNFSAITTQPVVSYTFDSADGLELAGEAKVADGVLNLATKETHNETYAKIADLSSFDFSNGITLTADVKVTGYISDWTPIFMLGDGKLAGEKEGCTLAYHFTQGFSSREDVSEAGYFGNGIAAPYAWDWYKNATSQNRWDTITITIDEEKMATYVNGVLVQSAETGFGTLMSALKAAKNNYLGSSYWAADPDFQGSLDNVGIYNTALTATDVAALTSAKVTTPEEPDNNDNSNVGDNSNDNNNNNDNTSNDNTGDDEPEVTVKKSISISGITAKANAKKITGKLSVSGAKVTVKVGSAKYKAAKVNGKKFTFTASKLKKGTKVTIKATKSGYKATTKSVKVQ